ncbi:MAG: enoyl-CoA hydratase/isomerase family protein [Bacteroidetes bacterium]|nr:enoyl-CoA hydratase/isomerase family protein [Bacteroidota bacterium]
MENSRMVENIILEQNQHIGWIYINRPEQLNALNQATIAELNTALIAYQENPAIGVVCISGIGEKAFVAGADIKEFADFSVSEGGALAQNGQRLLFDFIETMNKPVIAAINGFALGGGLELAMACHIRIASSNARMGLPEVSLGVIPGYGGTQRLPQLIGRGRANQLIFTGEMVNAERAKEWGLVNEVVEPSCLKQEVLSLASKILKNSPNALAKAIQSVNAGFDCSIDGYETEIRSFASCFGTQEFIKGTQAFLNKEKANFRG